MKRWEHKCEQHYLCIYIKFACLSTQVNGVCVLDLNIDTRRKREGNNQIHDHFGMTKGTGKNVHGLT